MINTEFYKNILPFLSKFNVKLIAVSKTKPFESILQLYKAGQRAFGENKVQELVSKFEVLPKDIEWHFIGNLQRNKVKYIAPFVSLIHSVDSLELLKEIDKQAKKNNRVIDCLLEFHIASEETKNGLDYEESISLLHSPEFKNFLNIRITGVMGMASFTENEAQILTEFKALKTTFDQLKADFFQTEETFKEISMGMSGDYELAIEAGSTMVRIGSSLFGKRD
jgi:pyridoxal phosphate enzyme (YggS family)